MNAIWIFFIIVLFCLYILIGLHITDGIESFIQTLLTWIIYTIMCSTLLNVFLLGYFWSVVHNKKGPTGLRGPIGERGPIGIEGKCELDLVEAYLIKELMKFIDDLYFAEKSRHILNNTTYTIPCTYVNNKIAVMAGSRQYKTIYKNLYVNYNKTLYGTSTFNTDTQQTDTKPIQSIISYLKNIWREWFNLIYNATTIPGEWFNDSSPDADENYKWSGTDPFIEIRKYDIYYWGLTRNFRPLKAEICRTNADEYSKLPIINQVLEPKLKIIKTNDYYQVGDSRNTNDDQQASIWSPNVVSINSDTYYPVGDLFYIGNNIPYKYGNTVVGNDLPGEPGVIRYNNSDSNGTNGPDMSTILVAGDVVSPVAYIPMVKLDSTSHAVTYTPVCPSGYTALGDVGRANGNCIGLNNNNKKTGNCTNFNNFKCVPSSCVEQVSPGIVSHEDPNNPNQWNRHNKWYNGMKARWSWTWYDNINTLNYSLYGGGGVDPIRDQSTGYNLFRAPSGSSRQPSAPFYKISDSCLAPPEMKKAKTKPLEPEFEDLGIGWYGHPYKMEPKYSIFSFLGIAPEGIIVHSGTGRRYYAIQYGGEEPDIYIILVEDDSGNYTNAIQTTSDKTKYNTNIRSISKKDTRQQWRIVLQPNDKKHFTLNNVFNSRNLNIDLEPRLGKGVHSTKLNNDPDNYLFSFIPAFGTHLNNIE